MVAHLKRKLQSSNLLIYKLRGLPVAEETLKYLVEMSAAPTA
jgi:hypothetical protein